MSVLLLSGGLDSSVLLAREVNSGRYPICLGFDYGQRHRRELWSAYQIAHYYGREFRTIEIPPKLLSGSAVTGGGPVPHGHYEDPAQQATVVPNRNMVLISLAVAFAVQRREPEVLFAAHKGDAAIYPDCRPEFVEAIDHATRLACGVGVKAPFLMLSKRDIAGIGGDLRFPFDMAWSCYEGGDAPCQKCGACVERNEALA